MTGVLYLGIVEGVGGRIVRLIANERDNICAAFRVVLIRPSLLDIFNFETLSDK